MPLSCRDQSLDLLANQLTGFYMRGTFIVKRLSLLKAMFTTDKYAVALLLPSLTFDEFHVLFWR